MIQGLYDFAAKWSENGAIWLYSDPHFSETILESGLTNKPADEEQVKLINSKVGKKDTIIFLGDIGNTDWIRKVRGYKVLVMGNHDSGASNYRRESKNFTYWDGAKHLTSKEVIKNFLANYPEYEKWSIHIFELRDKKGEPFSYEIECDNKLFDEVYEGPLFISEKIVLSHEPMNINFAFNIHGHNHSTRRDEVGHWNICSDIIKYTPIQLSTIIKSGRLNEVESIHRITIDNATKRKTKEK